jgi:hypothetical protein
MSEAPRSLNEPVGLRNSSFQKTFTPNLSPILAPKSGVPPSPKVTGSTSGRKAR